MGPMGDLGMGIPWMGYLGIPSMLLTAVPSLARSAHGLLCHREGIPGPPKPLVHAPTHRLKHDGIDLWRRVRAVEDDLACTCVLFEDDHGATAVLGTESRIFHVGDKFIPIHLSGTFLNRVRINATEY
jgi:hypothetical protein